jgi:tetratricopeptide (TPR) repeat protein
MRFKSAERPMLRLVSIFRFRPLESRRDVISYGRVIELLKRVGERGIKSLRPMAGNMLGPSSDRPTSRPASVKMTLQAAQTHTRFLDLVGRGDTLRDDRNFEQAEVCYREALGLLPLHGGYRVQYAHVLKEQQKHVQAFIHYCFALSTGAPIHDVAEHLVFAAKQAAIDADLSAVERLAAAWKVLERTSNPWDAPPVEGDFTEFARLFWGNTGLVTAEVVKENLLKCVTRKELFIAFLRSPETLRANPRLFILMRERGLGDV